MDKKKTPDGHVYATEIIKHIPIIQKNIRTSSSKARAKPFLPRNWNSLQNLWFFWPSSLYYPKGQEEESAT